MTDIVKQHLPVIVVVTLVGVATMYLVLSRVLAGVAGMDLGTFSTFTFGVPCVMIFVCSTVIALTSPGINRQLYVVIVGIGMVVGIASMIACNVWEHDSSITSALLANSPEGTTVTPILNSPILILRDIAAYFVAATVGSILGAWLGARLHPMTLEPSKSKRSKSSKASKAKKSKK